MKYEEQEDLVTNFMIIEANVLYQKYLETVVEQSDDFGSVNDILTRYATLHDARALLQVTADSHSHEIDATRTELSSLIKVYIFSSFLPPF